MIRYSIVLLAALLASPSACLPRIGATFKRTAFKAPGSTLAKTTLKESIEGVEYEVKYFTNNVDHFTSNNTNQLTYQTRYLVNETLAAGQTDPPILFYCGNEGNVTTFFENSGFMTKNLSAELKAVVLFGEHRYYGESLPFGNNSFTADNVKYLTVDQALMDYVQLIKSFKANNTAYANSPVFAFGGSYGGMLAAWFRIKYPHIIQGAHAASAPILFFPGSVSPYAFNELTARSYRQAFPSVENFDAVIQNGFDTLKQMATDSGSFPVITKVFNTCRAVNSSADIYKIMGDMSGNFGTMAMVNYPYETNFVAPLPANPVQYACAKAGVIQPSTDENKINILYQINNVFTNYTGKYPCTKLDADNDTTDETSGWNFQVCNEMVMPIGQSGKSQMDLYWADYWDYDGYYAYCQSSGLTPQFNWALDTFGGRNPQKDFMHQSNIYYTNGDLDPWRAGGLLYNISSNITVQLIKGGAHHLDLREPNDTADPDDVKFVRSDILAKINSWITTWKSTFETKTEVKSEQKLEQYVNFNQKDEILSM